MARGQKQGFGSVEKDNLNKDLHKMFKEVKTCLTFGMNGGNLSKKQELLYSTYLLNVGVSLASWAPTSLMHERRWRDYGFLKIKYCPIRSLRAPLGPDFKPTSKASSLLT